MPVAEVPVPPPSRVPNGIAQLPAGLAGMGLPTRAGVGPIEPGASALQPRGWAGSHSPSSSRLVLRSWGVLICCCWERDCLWLGWGLVF